MARRHGFLIIGALAATMVTALSAVGAAGATTSPSPDPTTLDLAEIYDISHVDLVPVGNLLADGQAVLAQYQSSVQQDPGLVSFQLLDQTGFLTNHYEMVDVWQNLTSYEAHADTPSTVAFRFGIQPDIGSPFDDRLYGLASPVVVSAPAATVAGLYVVTYVDSRPADPQVVSVLTGYGQAAQASGAGLLDYRVLRELARPNRFAVVEAWSSATAYNNWQSSAGTTNFLQAITPMLRAPLDHRTAILVPSSGN
jgi:quinol monooxygenase YgiN